MQEQSIPRGYCHCGCGKKTNVAERNFYRLDVLKGEPFRYISGHNRHSTLPEVVEEDRGFATPCWIFQLALEGNGYGRKRVAGKSYGAHRLYYERRNGPIPEGWHIHHRCAVRACVNPQHLEALPAATHVRLTSKRLTEFDVRRIKALLATDTAYGACARIARRFGVAPKTVNDIKHGKTWADV